MKTIISLISILSLCINCSAQKVAVSQIILQYAENIKNATDTISYHKQEKNVNTPSEIDFFNLDKNSFKKIKKESVSGFKLTEISEKKYVFNAYNALRKKIYEIRLLDSTNFAVGYTIIFDEREIPITDSHNLLYIDKNEKDIFFIEWHYKPTCNKNALQFLDYCNYMSIAILTPDLKPISRLLILSDQVKYFSIFKDNTTVGNIVEDIYFMNPYSRCGSNSTQFLENVCFTDIRLMNLLYDCLTIKMGTLHNNPFLYDITVFWKR